MTGSSEGSGSMNTSTDDWSDDESDDSDIDWDSEQAALGLGGQVSNEVAVIGEQWLQDEFRI